MCHVPVPGPAIPMPQRPRALRGWALLPLPIRLCPWWLESVSWNNATTRVHVQGVLEAFSRMTKAGGAGGTLGHTAGVRNEVPLQLRVAETPPGLILSPPREVATCGPRGPNRHHPGSWDFLERTQQVWMPGLGAGGVSPEGSLCSWKGAAPPAQQRRPGTRSSQCRGPEARRRGTHCGS